MIRSSLRLGHALDPQRLELGIALEHELPVRLRLRDHERAGARRRLLRHVPKRRVGRHRRRERQREQVIEGRVRAIEPDRDPPRPVVGLDARDVGLRLAALLVLDRADDPLVQERAGRAEIEDPPQRVLEVARLDGPAVRVHEAFAEPQL